MALKDKGRLKPIPPKPIKKPSKKRAKAYYELYRITKKAGFEDFKRNQIMTHVLGHERWSFRVVGISKAACLEIVKCGFRRPGPHVLERDHKTRSRGETSEHVFANDMNFNDWWDYVWEGDETIVTTKEENRASSLKTGDIINLNWEEGFFEDKGIGFKCRVRTEGEKVRELCEEFRL